MIKELPALGSNSNNCFLLMFNRSQQGPRSIIIWQ